MGLSIAQLFVDVKTAFAAVIKCLFVPHPSSDGAFLNKLREAGFDDRDIKDILSDVRDPESFVSDYGNRHLVSILARFGSCTWMSFEGLSGIIENQSGTMAG
eukprot:2628451-Karenia_brevis.AAC.1